MIVALAVQRGLDEGARRVAGLSGGDERDGGALKVTGGQRIERRGELVAVCDLLSTLALFALFALFGALVGGAHGPENAAASDEEAADREDCAGVDLCHPP